MSGLTRGRSNWKPSFKQKLTIARASAYVVTSVTPKRKRGAVRAKFWIHWIRQNTPIDTAGTGAKP